VEIKWIHDSTHHFAYIDDPETSKYCGIIIEDNNEDEEEFGKMYYWDIKLRDNLSKVKLVKSGGCNNIERCMRDVTDNLKKRFQLA
jgi:hypothetical protein